MTATLGLCLFAAAAPSPLYGLYAAERHFSAATLTAIFAVYAVTLLAALLAAGPASDTAGRRPVVLAGLVTQCASMALFLAADGPGWLFAARSAQGAATGLVTAAGAAALIDLQPVGRPGLGPLVNAVTPTSGLAAGAVTAGALVQYGPAPAGLRPAAGRVRAARRGARRRARDGPRPEPPAAGPEAGLGFGAAFLGAFRTLAALATPGRRGDLLAAVYVVAYLAFSLPAVIAGLAVTRAGLLPIAQWYGIVIAALAFAAIPLTALTARRS